MAEGGKTCCQFVLSRRGDLERDKWEIRSAKLPSGLLPQKSLRIEIQGCLPDGLEAQAILTAHHLWVNKTAIISDSSARLARKLHPGTSPRTTNRASRAFRNGWFVILATFFDKWYRPVLTWVRSSGDSGDEVGVTRQDREPFSTRIATSVPRDFRQSSRAVPKDHRGG